MCYSVAVEPPPPALTNAPGGSTSWGAFTIGYFSTNVLRGKEPNFQPDFRPPSDRLCSCKGALFASDHIPSETITPRHRRSTRAAQTALSQPYHHPCHRSSGPITAYHPCHPITVSGAQGQGYEWACDVAWCCSVLGFGQPAAPLPLFRQLRELALADVAPVPLV
jgi:hypothetical protein